jgi:hypothetical protein
MKACIMTVVIASIMVIAGSAWAQRGVINLDETVIKGRIEKPEAFYILQHANLNYEKLQPKQTFIPELLQSVDQKPF